MLSSNKTVEDLVLEILRYWPGNWQDQSDPNAPHEAGLLNLVTDKAYHHLGWQPRWNFETTIQRSVNWYRQTFEESSSTPANVLADILVYSKTLVQ